MAKASSILSITVLADVAKLKKGMGEASRSLKGLESNVKATAGRINGALGAIGVGFSISALVGMSKAAGEDARAFGVMANAIKNATGATDAQIQAADDYIQRLSMQTGITDDELRPAMQILASTYGDVTQAQDALGVAADLAAYKGISAEAAAQALAKAHKGNFTALEKLVPAIKGAADPLGELQRLTEGSAEASANSDPWARLNIIFENLQETIGTYLLPYLSAFGEWLSSPVGQEKMQMLSDAFGRVLEFVMNIVTWLSDNMWLVVLIGSMVVLVKTFITVYTITKKIIAAFKAMTVLQVVANAVKGMVGPAAIAGAIAAAAIGTGIVLGIGAMFPDDETAVDVPEAPTRQVIALPKPVKPPIPKGGKLPTVKDRAAAAKQAKDDIEKAIKTLQDQLAKVQKLIAETAQKFRDSVDMSVGLVTRGLGQIFRADRYVRELKRMQKATKDFSTNLKLLRAMGGQAANPLLEQILSKSPEEAAAIMRSFVASPTLFADAIKTSADLAKTGAGVGATINQMQGNQSQQALVNEIKLLRNDLAGGKNTYNIKATMTATEILNAIRRWEKSAGRKVLVT
jgi:hypothetical protein